MLPTFYHVSLVNGQLLLLFNVICDKKYIILYKKKNKNSKGKENKRRKEKKVANDHVTDMYDLRLQKEKKEINKKKEL